MNIDTLTSQIKKIISHRGYYSLSVHRDIESVAYRIIDKSESDETGALIAEIDTVNGTVWKEYNYDLPALLVMSIHQACDKFAEIPVDKRGLEAERQEVFYQRIMKTFLKLSARTKEDNVTDTTVYMAMLVDFINKPTNDRDEQKARIEFTTNWRPDDYIDLVNA